MDIEALFQKPPVQPLTPYGLKGITLSVLRLDLIHPEISGNKWFKLKENIRLAQKEGKSGLLTFGGCWSNHLAATAAIAKQLNLSSIGLVRADSTTTATLKRCEALGMKLVYLSPSDYRRKNESAFIRTIMDKYPDYFIVPEGGDNEAGRSGCGEIEQFIPDNITHLVLPVGTGTTFSGISARMNNKIEMMGFAPFKKIEEQVQNIRAVCNKDSEYRWTIYPDEIWRGFGKWDSRLIDFMNHFFAETHIPLDIVYTGKMMYYLKVKILEHYFPEESNILAIHTGGLQGNQSVNALLHFPVESKKAV